MPDTQILTDSIQPMTIYPQGYTDALQPDWTFWQQCADGYYLLIPIAVLLLAGIYVFIDRAIFAGAAARFDNALMQRIKDYIHENETESATNLCRKTNSAAARVVDRGVNLLGSPLAELSRAMLMEVDIEILRLKAGGTRWLNVAAVAAPLLGVAGAAAGMLRAAYDQLSTPFLITPLATLLWGAAVGLLAYSAAQYIKALTNQAHMTLLKTVKCFIDILNEPAS